VAPPFTTSRWIRNPHVQTLWGRLFRNRRRVVTERETFVTPDDDDLIVDHLPGDDRIRFVLLHGLEGSSSSVYIQGILAAIEEAGYAASALNFRSCARDPRNLSRMIPNRQARLYHSGETSDFDFLIRALRMRHPDSTFVAFGGSLGGNVLLKWLGENRGQDLLAAAATVSVPYDLGAGSRYMETRTGLLYVASFLRTLKLKARAKVEQFSEARERLRIEEVLAAKTFREFDDVATAPLHGFRDADDYYARSSSLGYLSSITTPVLCLSAADDPFLPPETLASVRKSKSAKVELIVSPHGGHLGFVGGGLLRADFWAERTVVDWLLGTSSRFSAKE
jgi:uncharacterized protein